MDHFRKFARLLRDLGIDASWIPYRPKQEHYVEMFRQEMTHWSDIVGFSMFADRVGAYQLHEFEESSYVPLNNILPRIMVEERGHIQYGENKLEEMAKDPDSRQQAQRAINKWYPRALDMFGRDESSRNERYREWGLERRSNRQARQEFIQEVTPVLEGLGYDVPPPDWDRRYG